MEMSTWLGEHLQTKKKSPVSEHLFTVAISAIKECTSGLFLLMLSTDRWETLNTFPCYWFESSTSRFLGSLLELFICLEMHAFKYVHSTPVSFNGVQKKESKFNSFLQNNFAHQCHGIFTHALHGLLRSPVSNHFPLRADQKLPEVPLWAFLCRFWEEEKTLTWVINNITYIIFY